MVAAQQGRARTPPPLHLCLSRRLDISSLVLSDTTNPSCQSGRAPHFAADRSRCSLWAPRLVTCGLNRCSGRASGPVRTRVTLGGARWGSHRAPCGVSPVGPTVARPGRCSVRSSPSSVIARQRPRGGVLTRSRHSWRTWWCSLRAPWCIACRLYRRSAKPPLGQAVACIGGRSDLWPFSSIPAGARGLATLAAGSAARWPSAPPSLGAAVAHPGCCLDWSSPSSVVARQRPSRGMLARSYRYRRGAAALAVCPVVRCLSAPPMLSLAAALMTVTQLSLRLAAAKQGRSDWSSLWSFAGQLRHRPTVAQQGLPAHLRCSRRAR